MARRRRMARKKTLTQRRRGKTCVKGFRKASTICRKTKRRSRR